VSFFQKALDGIREDLGHPASLLRALRDHPRLIAKIAADPASIALYSVTRWEELGDHAPTSWPRREQGDLQGWRAGENGRYESFRAQRSEYAALGVERVSAEWLCDLSQVHGFSSSKSRLEDFATTDQMVERNSPELIAEISHERLQANLAHSEIRILHDSDSSDHFVRREWDGRVFLVNGGGSHHLAAAKYIASRLGVRIPLKAPLHTHSLNAAALASLRGEFDMFVVGEEPFAWNAFTDAMEAYRATWLWHPLPRPRDRGARAVLLPKSVGRSRRVADELRGAGFEDLGAHLAGLIDRQASLARTSP